MLVLKVKLGQKIYIDDGAITLTLTHAGYGWAKIGVDAPAEVTVKRQGICPEGPGRCCKCGGTLPPPSTEGIRVLVSSACSGEVDPVSGRCRAFIASTLWGDLPIGQEAKDGAA